MFFSLKILKNKESRDIIEMLIKHFENYEHIYYNKPLHKILKKYKNDIFAIRKKNKRIKRAMRASLGLKLHTRTFLLSSTL